MLIFLMFYCNGLTACAADPGCCTVPDSVQQKKLKKQDGMPEFVVFLAPGSVLCLIYFIKNCLKSMTECSSCFDAVPIVAYILGAAFDPQTSIWGSPGLHFGVPGLHFSTLGLHFGCLGLPRGSQAEKD